MLLNTWGEILENNHYKCTDFYNLVFCVTDANMNNISTLSSVNSTITTTSNIFTILESNNQQIKTINDSTESTIGDNQEENIGELF